MCSTQCDNPVTPGRSYLDPTLYHIQLLMMGAVCISFRWTVSPFESRVAVISPLIPTPGYRFPCTISYSALLPPGHDPFDIIRRLEFQTYLDIPGGTLDK
jgi:hypothetical protein